MHRVLLPFEFAEPTSLAEVVTMVDGERTRVLAGGVDLVLKMRLRQIVPERVVSLQKVPGLDYVREDDHGLRIGALATLRQLERMQPVKDSWPLLREAVGSIASAQVKVMGTVVGNLCVGTPASDIAPALCALGATVVIAGMGSSREIALEDFFQDVGKTAVRPHEIVTEIVVPRPRNGSGSAFMKLGKTAEDIAKVNTAVFVETVDGVCTSARIALGSVGPTPLRANAAERLLEGRELGDGHTSGTEALSGTKTVSRGRVVAEAAEAAMQTAAPISDVRSTSTYRRQMVRVLVRDALERAISRALHGGEQ